MKRRERLIGNFLDQVLRLQPTPSRRARSAADFISKIAIVTEETDETLFWFELLVESNLINVKLVEPLMSECDELLKIFSVSLVTARSNR